MDARRRGLPWVVASNMLNSVFAVWTFGGSVFVLLMDELGMPKGMIGAVLSLFPFCGMLALGFAPVAARWGRKRVFLGFYATRKIVMAGLLALPWAIGAFGNGAGIGLLLGLIFLFAVLRALAETAYYPWAQEFIPNDLRGRFSAWSTVLTMVASAGALAVAGHVLGQGSGVGRYLLLIGTGSAIGLIGVALMIPVSGGAPVLDPARSGGYRGRIRAALADGNFRAYLGGAAGMALGSGMLMAFIPLYATERLGLASATVVRLDILTMVGGALSSLACGWLSDRAGSRPVVMPCAALLTLVSLGWVLLPRDTPYAAAFCGALYALFGVAYWGLTLGALRLLYNGVVPPSEDTAYMAIYYAWIGVAGGAGPLLAGGLLTLAGGRSEGVLGIPADGYTLVFAAALACLAVSWRQFGRVRPDGRHTTRSAMRGAMIWWAQR